MIKSGNISTLEIYLKEIEENKINLTNQISFKQIRNSLSKNIEKINKLLNNLNIDLLITGEFSHHEILHEVHRGVTLILTDHSNNEVYFLMF